MKTKLRKKKQLELNYRREKFFEKIEEYSKLTLDELKELFNHPDKKKRPGGIYREALIEVVRRKQLEQINETIKESKEELKVEESSSEKTE